MLAAGLLLIAFGAHGALAPVWQGGNSEVGGAVALLLGVYVTMAAARRLRRAWRTRLLTDRLRFGLCPYCAYDLRGSRDRCPECGKPVWIRL